MSDSERPDFSVDTGLNPYEEILRLRQHVSCLEADLETIRIRKHFRARRGPVVLFQSLVSSRGDLPSLPVIYISENVRQFGYEAADLVGHNIDLVDLMHPEDRRVVNDIVGSGTESPSMNQEYTYRFRTAGGSYRWVTHVSELHSEPDGKSEILMGTLLDVTSNLQKEQALVESHEILKLQVGMLGSAWEEIISLLVGITELRDPYTMGHQRKVAHLAAAIATGLELEEEQIVEMYNAALVHDIGKIHIPNDYLSKPGKLTEKEFSIIKEHAQVGADLLRKIHLPWHLADIVVQHHERLDGSGYPNGLQGDEIQFSARILAVADVIEAMASHRPYRPALGLDVALEEVTTKAGRLYDRDVVDVCRDLFLNRGYDWSDVDLQVSPLQACMVEVE